MANPWSWECDTDEEALGLVHVMRAKGLEPELRHKQGQGACVRIDGAGVRDAAVLSRELAEHSARKRDHDTAQRQRRQYRRAQMAAVVAAVAWLTLLWTL